MSIAECVFLLDTNIIIRFLAGDHQDNSTKATAFMQLLDKGAHQAKLFDFVLVEVAYVLEGYYEIPRSEIVEKLSNILSFKGIINHNRHIQLTALQLYKESQIDLVDCLLAAYSSSKGPVVSFDADMQRLGAFIEPL